MKRVPASKVSFSEDGFYYCDGEPFTGVTYTEYPGGAPRSESEYREGLGSGKSRSWYKDGTLYAETEMFRDVQHGVAREWSKSGQLVSEVTAEYGITIRERTWDEQGNLLKDYQLKEGDPAHARLLEFRKLYGAESPK